MRILDTFHAPAFSDYSEWLKQGDNLAREDEAWLSDHTQARREIAKIVNRVMDENGLRSVIEFGCGTGWLGTMLHHAMYIGVDANPGCIYLANERNTSKYSAYVQSELRECRVESRDLACSFSFLKHFGLHEWKGIMDQFLSFGRYAIFTLQTTEGEDEEDGTEYHHVWISPETLRGALRSHEVLYTENRWVDPHSDKKDVLFVVRKKQ